MKQLQHTSKMSETLETYICNIGEGRSGPADSSVGVGAGGERRRTSTTSIPAALVGALVSTKDYLRRLGMCA
jgi:hypothetical protein